jgi:hypothetical protein
MFQIGHYRHYIIPIIVLVATSFLYDQYKIKIEKDDEFKNYDLVKKYLLNGSSLAKSKKPIIWVHVQSETNSRHWKNFSSRNTSDINQPYLYFTLKSIIDKCGSDFNICVIDDNTFEKIIPGWSVEMKLLADPMKSKIRDLALAKIVYYYGGMIVPSSFLCFKSLIPIYNEGVKNDSMFVCEMLSRSIVSSIVDFFPSSKIMGCVKNCGKMEKYVNHLEILVSNDFTDESNFIGECEKWLFSEIRKPRDRDTKTDDGSIRLIKSEALGLKDEKGHAITIEMLMGNTYVQLSNEAIGVYIPSDEIAKRVKYEWFCRLSSKQVLESETIIGKLILTSIAQQA